ncbi:JAB domain-containing protein [Variovorax sp. KK3]
MRTTDAADWVCCWPDSPDGRRGRMAYIKELKVTFTRKRVDDDLLNKPVESPRHVYELFRDMQDETKEKVVVLHLNPQLEVLSYEVASIGTGRNALIEPIEVFRNAILARATSIIVVHNHPSGNCAPSTADTEVADRMHALGELHNLRLQDFIIIGDDQFYSFRERSHF